MVKASLELSNGTKVIIEGNTQEVNQLLSFYRDYKLKDKKEKEKAPERIGQKKLKKKDKDVFDLAEIVNLIKECDEAASIEENILDRTSVVDRVLLPLYIVHEYMNNTVSLKSSDINKITKELGVQIFQPNVSRTLTQSASRYVTSDRTRKGKRAIKYKLNRRGVKYLKGVIQG